MSGILATLVSGWVCQPGVNEVDPPIRMIPWMFTPNCVNDVSAKGKVKPMSLDTDRPLLMVPAWVASSTVSCPVMSIHCVVSTPVETR
jgi:hypothetical protein